MLSPGIFQHTRHVLFADLMRAATRNPTSLIEEYSIQLKYMPHGYEADSNQEHKANAVLGSKMQVYSI